MTTQSSLTVTGTIDGIPVTTPVILNLARKTVQDIELPSGALDVEVSFGAVTHPEVLIVASDPTGGGKGISWRAVPATGAPIPSNPISFFTNLDGEPLDKIYLSNSDSQAHLVTVTAGE